MSKAFIADDVDADEMLDELTRVFFSEADRIRELKDVSVAEAFIGFKLQGRGYKLSHLHQDMLDYDRFPAFKLFAAAFAFICHPCPTNVMDSEDVRKLQSFMLHVPRAEAGSALARQYPFMSSENLCRNIVDTASARCKLEVDRSDDFTIHELALLAGLSDEATSGSLAPNDGEGSDRNDRTRQSTVDFNTAKNWLAKQPGFQSSWKPCFDDE